MSMRPRGAAVAARRPRSGIHPVYEDFKPTFEWKHEEGASILLYHLPGFAKEQIRIIAESKGILKVRGEPLLTSKKWSRFQEEVVVPEDCNMDEIRAKFESGVLQITMPKKMIDKKNPIEEQSNTTLHKPPTSSVTRPNVQPKPQPKLQDQFPSKPTLPTNPPFPIPRKGENKPQHRRQQEDLKQSQNNLDDTYQHVPNHRKEKVTNDHKAEEDLADIVDPKRVETSRVKDKEGKEKHEEAISGIQENHEMYDDALDQEKFYESGKSSRFGGDHKSHITSKFDEDGQLLMNMGAAVLVIVALGTYITYSFGYGD